MPRNSVLEVYRVFASLTVPWGPGLQTSAAPNPSTSWYFLFCCSASECCALMLRNESKTVLTFSCNMEGVFALLTVPWGPGLQTSAAPNPSASCSFLFFCSAFECCALMLRNKIKNHLLRRWQRLSGSGAGGSRTLVQTGNPYVFYMLSRELVVGIRLASGGRPCPYSLSFRCNAGTSLQLARSHEHLRVGKRQAGFPGDVLSRLPRTGIKLYLHYAN